MKLAYFDCFSGISGDMMLGALVDAGAELAQIDAELRKLSLSGWSVSAEKVQRGAIRATQVHVAMTDTHHHRGLAKILEIIESAKLPPRVTHRSRAVFERLAEAEAHVHGLSIDKVHFHEVGAVDAIVDIVGSCAGFELLGIEEFAFSPLNVGGGRVQSAHGVLPVPAPATAELLRGAQVYATGIERELVTPTGAAFIAGLQGRCGPMPAMSVAKIGYGAGSGELKEQPNVLRMFLGAEATKPAAWDETIMVMETNLDDMNPQIYGYLAEQALAAGALDIFSAPVQMKKNRPGLQVTILCKPEDADRMVDLLFRESTTIGVRTYEARRRALERESVTVDTSWGPVRMKLSRQNGLLLNAAPEYDDCRRIAAERGVPLKQVIAEAVLAFEQQRGRGN